MTLDSLPICRACVTALCRACVPVQHIVYCRKKRRGFTRDMSFFCKTEGQADGGPISLARALTASNGASSPYPLVLLSASTPLFLLGAQLHSLRARA
jgi:hypothetical protein